MPDLEEKMSLKIAWMPLLPPFSPLQKNEPHPIINHIVVLCCFDLLEESKKRLVSFTLVLVVFVDNEPEAVAAIGL